MAKLQKVNEGEGFFSARWAEDESLCWAKEILLGNFSGITLATSQGRKKTNHQPDSVIALKAFATNFQLYSISSDWLLHIVIYTYDYCNSKMAILKMVLNAILCYFLIDTYI